VISIFKALHYGHAQPVQLIKCSPKEQEVKRNKKEEILRVVVPNRLLTSMKINI
jgi:hypothetical protein